MLITSLAKIILGLLGMLFFFELPQFPDTVVNVFNSVISYMGTGLDVLHAFIGNTAMGVLGTCLSLVLIANGAYFVVSLVFFVLKKIPFLGLKE